MKHTSGVWEVMPHKGVVTKYDVTSQNEYGDELLICSCGQQGGEEAANARLIASAPDLLSLAKFYIAMYDQETKEDSHRLVGTNEVNLYVRCEAIVKKIEGK